MFNHFSFRDIVVWLRSALSPAPPAAPKPAQPEPQPEPPPAPPPTPPKPTPTPEPVPAKGGSMFRLSNRSKQVLSTVEEPLRRVVELAITRTTVDFGVVQGGRTLDEQKRLYGKGRTAAQCIAKGVPASYARPNESKVTWTLNSNHLVGPNGLGRAVDLMPYINGKAEWDNSGRLGLWPKIAEAMLSSAVDLGVPVVWGGIWTSTPDRPHFELRRGT